MLKNKFLEDRNDYNKSIHSVFLVRKSKVKRKNKKPTLNEKDEILESDINTVQIVNTFFSSLVSNLKMATYANV